MFFHNISNLLPHSLTNVFESCVARTQSHLCNDPLDCLPSSRSQRSTKARRASIAADVIKTTLRQFTFAWNAQFLDGSELPRFPSFTVTLSGRRGGISAAHCAQIVSTSISINAWQKNNKYRNRINYSQLRIPSAKNRYFIISCYYCGRTLMVSN